MSDISDLKNVVKQEQSKRIGTITGITEGAVLITDLLDRKFSASVPNEINVIVGNSVIVVGDCVIGKTESLKEPKVFLV